VTAPAGDYVLSLGISNGIHVGDILSDNGASNGWSLLNDCNGNDDASCRFVEQYASTSGSYSVSYTETGSIVQLGAAVIDFAPLTTPSNPSQASGNAQGVGNGQIY
jgi:hypothetical protein